MLAGSGADRLRCRLAPAPVLAAPAKKFQINRSASFPLSIFNICIFRGDTDKALVENARVHMRREARLKQEIQRCDEYILKQEIQRCDEYIGILPEWKIRHPSLAYAISVACLEDAHDITKQLFSKCPNSNSGVILLDDLIPLLRNCDEDTIIRCMDGLITKPYGCGVECTACFFGRKRCKTAGCPFNNSDEPHINLVTWYKWPEASG